MQPVRYAIAISGALLISATAASAQMRSGSSVPADAMPPAGMCRVWIEGVETDRQPAPTDCATARERAASTDRARVIYGSSNGGVYHPNDPRYDPRRGSNDPRYDPRNERRTDPRYDPRNDRRTDGRYDPRADRARDRWDRKEHSERAKSDKKHRKEMEKARKHGHRGGDHDDDRDRHDDDRDDDHR